MPTHTVFAKQYLMFITEMLSEFYGSEPKGLVVFKIHPHMNSAKEEPPTRN